LKKVLQYILPYAAEALKGILLDSSLAKPYEASAKYGGATGTRTLDPRLAKAVL
jgi:hypothetical protein